jgi:hypothetical protein
MKRLSQAMSPAALVISILALVLSTGFGSAYAAVKISTKQIKNGAVTAPKLAPKAVTAPKIAPNAVGSAAIANGSVGLGDLAGGVKAGLVAPLVWTPISLNTGWATGNSVYSTNVASWAKDQLGIVHLQGGLSNPTHTTTVVGTLPAGARPGRTIYAIGWGYATQSPSFVVITASGQIAVSPQSSASVPNNAMDFTSLESITFTAATN